MPASKQPANPYVGFKPLKTKLAKRPDVRSPRGLSAWIGRAKYGHKAFQAAAAAGRPLGHNPNVIIHYLSTKLFKKARKKAIELAQLDADRAGRPVAIVDAASGRVLKFVRPGRKTKNPGVRPRKAQGHVRFHKVAGRTRIEVYG